MNMGTNALRAANQEPQEFILDDALIQKAWDDKHYLDELTAIEEDLILEPLPLDEEPTTDWWEDEDWVELQAEAPSTTAPQWSINIVTTAMNIVAKLVSPFCTVIIAPKVKQ